MPQSPALQGSFQPLPGVKGGAVQQCAIVVVADKVTVLDHAGAVGWTQQGAHLHSVRLVPHIQQDHVKVEGGIRGYEPRCEGRTARVGMEWKSEPPAWPRPPPPLFPLLPHQARIDPPCCLIIMPPCFILLAAVDDPHPSTKGPTPSSVTSQALNLGLEPEGRQRGRKVGGSQAETGGFICPVPNTVDQNIPQPRSLNKAPGSKESSSPGFSSTLGDVGSLCARNWGPWRGEGLKLRAGMSL